MPNGAGLVLASARRKSDKVDAAMLAQLLRGDLLPEAWIPLAAGAPAAGIAAPPGAAGAVVDPAAEPDLCHVGWPWS